MNSAIYIHFPFCTQKCKYCDFFSLKKDKFIPFIKRSEYGHSTFANKIIFDLQMQKSYYDIQNFSSIFIGGGTPSIMSHHDINFIGQSILEMNRYKNVEFTIEMNPETVSYNFLLAAIDNGINRLSMGIQTLDNAILKKQNRLGSKNTTLNALKKIKNISIKKNISISIDLIVGFPEQTKTIVLSDIKQILEFYPEHISVYSLCTSDNREDSENDSSADLLEFAYEILKSHGYKQYEISNFAIAEKYECKHNKSYWNMDTYLGIGPGSVGTIINKKNENIYAIRTNGIKNIEKWITAKDIFSSYKIEDISKYMLIQESIMMGFRLLKGINLIRFKNKFNILLTDLIGKTITRWKDKNLLYIDNKFCYLNKDGILFLNRFLIDAFYELEQYKKLHTL